MWQVWSDDVYLYSVFTEAEVMEAEMDGYAIVEEEMVA